MKRLLISGSFLVAFLLPPVCPAQSYQPPFIWPQTLEEAKELELTNAEETAVVNDGQTEPNLEDGPFVVVNGFTFARLESNRIYLVAITDTGKGFFFDLIVKYCGARPCDEAVVRAVDPHNLNEELIDLDADGVDEIVTKDFAGGYEGAATELVYKYTIYKVVDGKAVDVSDRYKSYYESTLLPKMRANVAALRARAANYPKELEVIDALDTMAQDDYQRRVLRNARAGLDHAKEWIHSDNERLRDYAVQSFTAINDPEVEQILIQTKGDANPDTAKAASWALESWRAMKHARGAVQSK